MLGYSEFPVSSSCNTFSTGAPRVDAILRRAALTLVINSKACTALYATPCSLICVWSA